MRIAPIQDHPDIVRDLETNAILAVDKTAIDAFNEKRKKILQERKEKEEIQSRLNQMEGDVKEIKDLLRELIRSQNAN